MESPMEMFNEDQFKKRYRFTKNAVRDIIFPMVQVQDPITYRGLPVPTMIGLLLTLRFYATGNFQVDTIDFLLYVCFLIDLQYFMVKLSF